MEMDLPVDIVTLENLEQSMPRWSPANSSHLYALVDMGSNGIRFSISDLSPPRARLLSCVYRERAAISLFDALNGSSGDAGSNGPLTFPPETIKLVSQTLARFRAIAVDDYGVPPSQVTVFATEAMRRAQNAASMLEAIRAEAPDLVVHILAPHVEILFGSVGARSGFVDVKGLFLDLGGGSVQMTYMDTYAAKVQSQRDGESEASYEVTAALAGQSLPFGAARLIRVLESAGFEVQSTEKQKLHSGMCEAFERLRAKFPTLAATVAEPNTSGIDIYLCGGGFRGYGSMLMHDDPIKPYPIPAIGSYTVSGEAFVRTKHLLKVNDSYDGKIFGMSKRRRSQFPAIVAVVDALIAAVPRIRYVTFCAGGNREGALVMKLPREIRESNPLTHLADPYHGQEEAAEQRGQDIVATLVSALPASMGLAGAVNVFGLQLGDFYASQIWTRNGEDASANAAAALHDAIMQNPSCPGLTHLSRAILGLTLCSRWGADIGPIDAELHRNLQALVTAADPDAVFWAEYIGVVTAALAKVVTTRPRTKDAILNSIRFKSSVEQGKKKLKIHLDICVSEASIRGHNPQHLIDILGSVTKGKDNKKVTVTISQL
ncbi:Ppx/GppA phosphatase family-domain-containing protein [Podospora didyma]|uniref:Ppx/GppA phosphatase family-domain-containing protein n=1 Tax=Podospora didyma TaxID=330526 RepID=A0AAE0P5F1_9PEZI|nr:Ppx/GppA phosphatase family-domain-containing protein [Podospora didyma]